MTVRPNRLPIMLSDDELDLIEEFRFDNRIGTMAGAMRKLMMLGIERAGELAEAQSEAELLAQIETLAPEFTKH